MFQDGQRAALRGSAKLRCHFSLGPSWGAVQPNTVTTNKLVQSQCSQAHPSQINHQRPTCPETHRGCFVSSNRSLIADTGVAKPPHCSLCWEGHRAVLPCASRAMPQDCDKDFFSLGNPRSRQGGPATARLPRWSFPSGDGSSVTSPGLTQGRLED